MNALFKKYFLLSASCIFPLICSCKTDAPPVQKANEASIYQDLPFKMDQVKRPSFPDYSVNIIEFGAKNDGKTLNTELLIKRYSKLMPKEGVK